MSLRLKAKQNIAAFLRKPIEELKDETVLTDIVHDSFILVEMVIELQENLKIRLHQEDLAEVKTMGDLLQVIENKQ